MMRRNAPCTVTCAMEARPLRDTAHAGPETYPIWASSAVALVYTMSHSVDAFAWSSRATSSFVRKENGG